MREVWTRDGGKRVELFVPFKHGDKKVESITFRPLKFDHVMRWREGKLRTALDLMAALCDLPVLAIREIGFPDFDRVMTAFLTMLPPEIQENINRGADEQPVGMEPIVPLSPAQQGPGAKVGPLPPSVRGGSQEKPMPPIPPAPMPDEDMNSATWDSGGHATGFDLG